MNAAYLLLDTPQSYWGNDGGSLVSEMRAQQSRMRDSHVSVSVPTKGQHEKLRGGLASIVPSNCGYAYEELITVDRSSDDADIKVNRHLAENSGAIYCLRA